MNDRTLEKTLVGGVEAIFGPMFSGKSTMLGATIEKFRLARIEAEMFKPLLDTRSDEIKTHDDLTYSAITISDASEIAPGQSTGVVGIDEGQFFEENLVEVVNALANRGIWVVVAGLNMDWKAELFHPMPEIIARAEVSRKLRAVCVRCGHPADYTYRLSGGGEQIQVGGKGDYEARCRICYFGLSLS